MHGLTARARLGALAMVGAATMLCMAASGGCGTSLHKAEISAGAIAASLHTAATINHSDPLETPAERAIIAGYIVEAAAANDNFIGVLKTAESQGATANPALISAALTALVTEVNTLNAQGILHIKNPEAQAHFAIVISSIEASITAIQALYPPGMAQTPAPAHRSPYGPLAALTLTAEEVEELIALAIAAGSALVTKLESLRGETGPEILTGAAADDAAAEQIAGADATATS